MDNSHKTALWTQITPSGLSPRSGHASVVCQGFIITFGGNLDDDFLNDIVVFDPKKEKRAPVNIRTAAPVRRTAHTLCVDSTGRNIIRFGGYVDWNQASSDLESFHVILVEGVEGVTIECKVLNATSVSGRVPEVAWHTANVYENKMYVFGGTNGRGEFNEDLWELDLDCLVWKKCKTKGNPPASSFATSGAIHAGKLYIFGGINKNYLFSIDLGSMQWTSIKIREAIPLVRFVPMQAYEGVLYLFGGSGGTIIGSFHENNDVITYCIETNTWDLLKGEQGSCPKERCKASSVIFENKLYILGGDFCSEKLSDIWSLYLGGQEQEFIVNSGSLNLMDLFTERIFADFVLEVDGKEFPTHKAILAKRCKFFANLFESGMSDSNLTRLAITDAKSPSYEALLRFIYCDPKLALGQDLALELLVLSDKYLMPDLKAECERILARILSLDNFLKIVEAAEAVDSVKLKEDLSKFAIRNAKILKERGDLYNLSKGLLIEILTNIQMK